MQLFLFLLVGYRLLARVEIVFHFFDDSDLGKFKREHFLNTAFENLSICVLLKVL